MRSRGTELVAGVEHDAVTLHDADPPGGDQLGAGMDPGDLASAEPDQLDRSGAVVQLPLEGRYAAARAERDRAQRAVQRDHLPVMAAGDGPRAAVLREVLENLGVLLVAVTGQPPEGTPQQPSGFVATHDSSVVRQASSSGAG